MQSYQMIGANTTHSKLKLQWTEYIDTVNTLNKILKDNNLKVLYYLIYFISTYPFALLLGSSTYPSRWRFLRYQYTRPPSWFESPQSTFGKMLVSM